MFYSQNYGWLTIHTSQQITAHLVLLECRDWQGQLVMVSRPIAEIMASAA